MGDERAVDYERYRRERLGLARPLDPDKARAIRRANLRQDIDDGLIADFPAARNTDPDTSHRAADAMRASGCKAAHQKLVLDAVTRLQGLTYVELAVQCGLEKHAVMRRLRDLELAGKVVKGEERRSGRYRYTTWWLP